MEEQPRRRSSTPALPDQSGCGSSEQCAAAACDAAVAASQGGSMQQHAPLPQRLHVPLRGNRSVRGAWHRRQPQLVKLVPLFQPWFVEAAFWSQYARHTLLPYDRAGLLVSTAVWVAAYLTSRTLHPAVWLLAVLGAALSAGLQLLHHARPAAFLRCRRAALLLVRVLAMVQLAAAIRLKPTPPGIGPWAAALLNMFVRSGGMFSQATYIVADAWTVVAVNAAVDVLVLGSGAPSACRHILAGPHPTAGWQAGAALFDRAALGVFRRSLEEPSAQHAVCCSALSTSLVVLFCCKIYVTHWVERTMRLRYKQQLPPAVAAMQPHIYGLPWVLVAAEGMLLVMYPAAVAAWLASGAWHGLWR